MTNFPLVSLVHKNDTELIGGGYDCLPMHYKKDGDQWYVLLYQIVFTDKI